MEEKKLSHTCDQCEKSFSNDQILSLHLKSVHKSITTSSASKIQQKFDIRIYENVNETPICKTCDKGF